MSTATEPTVTQAELRRYRRAQNWAMETALECPGITFQATLENAQGRLFMTALVEGGQLRWTW